MDTSGWLFWVNNGWYWERLVEECWKYWVSKPIRYRGGLLRGETLLGVYRDHASPRHFELNCNIFNLINEFKFISVYYICVEHMRSSIQDRANHKMLTQRYKRITDNTVSCVRKYRSCESCLTGVITLTPERDYFPFRFSTVHGYTIYYFSFVTQSTVGQ